MKFQLDSMHSWLVGAAVGVGAARTAATTAAQFTDPTQSIGVRPELLKEVGIDQKLNDQVPLDLTFRDEHWQARSSWRSFSAASR